MSDAIIDLIEAVDSLDRAAKQNAAALAQQAASSRRHRGWIAATVIGLCLDMALSGLFWWQHEQQNCRNDRSAQFFAAEQAKVAGQVAGLKKIRSAGADHAQAQAGFNQFIDASQHYLVVIGRLGGC